jgi:transcriptional regulator with XRE-family HTH domain
LSQKEAAKRLGCCWTTLLNWEKGKREPSVGCIAPIIAFLGYDPFPEPRTLSEQLAALRRKRGWSIKQAAHHLGVDPGTWGRWEKMSIPWTRHQRMVAAFVRAKPHREAGYDEYSDVSDSSADGESEGINVR